MTKSKKIFLILLLTIFLIFLFGNFIFAAGVEVEYPQVPGAETPKTVKTFFPKYVQYLFNFSIIIAGLVAFGSLIYGGFRYLTSAGSPVALSDARSQITAGILGLIILLASYLLLTQINPQLVILKVGTFQLEKGVILYAGACQGANPTGEEGKDFLRVRRSLSSLEDFNDKTKSIYLYHSSDELGVYIYPQEGFKPEDGPSWKSTDFAPFDPKCFSFSGQSKSILLYWKMPGVYLYETTNCQSPPEPRLFAADSGDFGDFHDKAKSIKILPFTQSFCFAGIDAPPGPCKKSDPKEVAEACKNPACQETYVIGKFGVILHENSDFEGDAEVFFGGEVDLWPPKCIPLVADCSGPDVPPDCPPECHQNMDKSYCYEHVRDRASAITLFLQRPPGSPAPSGGVTLYSNYNFNEDDGGETCGPYPHPPMALDKPIWIKAPGKGGPGNVCNVLDNKASSIKIEGDYIAVLFRDEGRGEVFRTSDLRLKGNHIGDNAARFMLVIPVIK